MEAKNDCVMDTGGGKKYIDEMGNQNCSFSKSDGTAPWKV